MHSLFIYSGRSIPHSRQVKKRKTQADNFNPISSAIR